MKIEMLKHPSALIPVLMSLAALIVVLFQIAVFGTARQPDEGMAGNLFHGFMIAQVPFIGYFVARWVPEAPREAAKVLAIQFLAWLAAWTPLFLLNWCGKSPA